MDRTFQYVELRSEGGRYTWMDTLRCGGFGGAGFGAHGCCHCMRTFGDRGRDTGRSGCRPGMVLKPGAGWWLAVGLLALTAGLRGVSARPTDNGRDNMIGCIWRSSVSPTMPIEQHFTPRTDCGTGELWWYDPYPGYRLRTFFYHDTTETDFRLCFQHHEKSHVMRMHNEKGANSTPIPPPSSGKESCIDSVKGSIEICFEAPHAPVHVTVIKYEMRQPP